MQRRITENLQAISERLIASIVDNIPAYGSADAALTSELRGIARWLVTRLMEIWVSNEQPTAEDLRRFRSIGTRRGGGGWPTPVLLRSYRVGAVELVETIRELSDDALNADDLLDLHRVMLTGLDTIAEAVLAGHDEAVARLANSPRHAMVEFLDDLLSGRHSSTSAIEDRAHQLGIASAKEWNVMVVRSVRRGRDLTIAEVSEFAESVARSASSPLADARMPLCTLRGSYGVIVFSRVGDMEQELRKRAWHACVMTGTQATRVASLFRIACMAIEFAPEGAYETSCALSAADAMFVCLVRAQGEVDPTQFSQAALGDLLSDRNVHLMESLDALFHYGSAVDAAAGLGIHVQTMRQRLRRINDITSRDIFNAWDRSVLGAACLARPSRRAETLSR